MPYADPEKQKAAMRERYRERYERERGFRSAENTRKRELYATNRRYAKAKREQALAWYHANKA
jgi:hypothetical protein